jgi:hypothetical protein
MIDWNPMNDKNQGTVSILASMLVLFTALLSPVASIFLSVVALAALGIMSLKKSSKG